jgi:hypothetical protein
VKKQMAARINPAATQFSRARASAGRCQLAHHQTCLIEVECMAIPIAAIAGRRNWICGRLLWELADSVEARWQLASASSNIFRQPLHRNMIIII